jgi:raffinose/stachyose/melibiose transport system permease protein
MVSIAGSLPRTRVGRQRFRRGPLREYLIHAGLIVWGLLCIYPMLWLGLTSLKFTPELYRAPFALPTNWVWTNYSDAWVLGGIGKYFFNSLVVTIASTVIVLFIGSTCAFALARFDFRLKRLVWAYILFGFLVPHSVVLIPLAIFTRTLNVYDNIFGLALIYAAIGVPFHTFFLRAFMETIPKELEEAAIVDGAGMWTVYSRIMLPLSQPALTTMATFNVLYSWSEFVLALVLTGTAAARTLPVGVSMLVTVFVNNEPQVSAGMVITLIPAVLAFAFLQRYVIQGLTAGALKA